MKEKWTEEMRRKLEGHRKAPPEGLWEGISEQMGFKPKEAGKEAKHPGVASHPAAKRWYWAAAAAVLLIGGFFTFYHHDGKDSSSLTATRQRRSQQKSWRRLRLRLQKSHSTRR